MHGAGHGGGLREPMATVVTLADRSATSDADTPTPTPHRLTKAIIWIAAFWLPISRTIRALVPQNYYVPDTYP